MENQNFLSAYKDEVAQIAVIVTIVQFLSGFFILNDIRKAKSSEKFPVTPFLGGIVLTIASLKYGFLINDAATVKVNIFGFILNTIYVCFYYLYTPNHKKVSVWSKIGLSGIIAGACLAYSEYEDPMLVETRYGLLMTVILIALVSSPFLHLNEIIKTKSTEGLPLPIILSGGIVSMSWALYGVAINNSILIMQNIILLAITAAQLSLFIIYPSKNKSNVTKKVN